MKKLTTYVWQHCMVALLCISMLSMSACSVDQILSDIDIALQASESIALAIGTVSTADATEIQNIADIGISGLKVIQTAYSAYEANKTTDTLQNLELALTQVQANLKDALAVAKIKNVDAIAKITAWVAFVTTTLNIIAKAVGKAKSNPNNKVAMVDLAASVPTPESLHTRWLNEVCKGDQHCGKLVKIHHKRK